MSRFAYESTVRAEKAPGECLEAAREELARMAAEPRAEGGQLVGKLGSGWKVRLLGTTFASPESFPLRIVIGVREGAEAREVGVWVEEAFGAGSLAGIGEKVQRRCDEVGTALASRLEARLR